MVEALRERRCMSEIFSEIYAISRPGFQVSPMPGCGGCCRCFESSATNQRVMTPPSVSLWDYEGTVKEELKSLLGGGRNLAIFYSPEHLVRGWQIESKIERVIQWFISRGIQNLVVPMDARSSFDSVFSGVSGAEVFVFDVFEPLYMPRLPTLVFLPEGSPMSQKCLPKKNQSHKLPECILVLPNSARDPIADHRFLKDTLQIPTYNADEICARMGL